MPWVRAAALMAQWPGLVKADLGNLGGEEEVTERGTNKIIMTLIL